MLDTTTKKRIDDCRDILVGKLPDPKAQIEQITIGLIYKFMDDMDKEAVELGGEKKFFSNYTIPDPNDPTKEILVEFEKYSWDNLFDTRVTATEMLSLYAGAIAGMDKNPNIPQLFRNIFKNAFLPYRDPETLKMFLKTIDEFTYTHSEKLGDAFEYLLSVMGSQGDAGQFRTPRHIIDFLVAVVDPKKTDTILDPACGTAGFLISAFKYIMGNGNDGNDGHCRDAINRVSTMTMTPDEQKRLIQNFTGYDISPDMVRLSLVNLYLHGFSDPHIWEYDTLSSEDRWKENYDVILANPPFMSPKGGIRPHKKFSISSNRSEVLFVDYIAEHLNPNGRAGIIVPEGVIFQSGSAYKDLRKMLVENYLYAVVSLPAGVFNPYSGVKTSILLMDKQIAKTTGEILFVKVANDGYGLGAQRNAVKGGQLDDAIEIIREFVAAIKNDGDGIDDGIVETPNLGVSTISAFTPSPHSDIAHTVPKSEIAKNGDYNLSGERYKFVLAQQSSFPIVELGSYIKVDNGRVLTEFDEKGNIACVKVGDMNLQQNSNEIITSSHWIKSTSYEMLPVNSIIFPKRGAAIATNKKRITRIPCLIDNNCMGITVIDENILNPQYLFEFMRQFDLTTISNSAGIALINNPDIKGVKIPLPPLSIQHEIVAEIEGYQKIIDGAKMVVENYKPKITIDPEWEMVELGDLTTFVQGINTAIDKLNYVDSGIKVLQANNIYLGTVNYDNLKFITQEEYDTINVKYKPNSEDVLYSNIGARFGYASILENKEPCTFSWNVLRLIIKDFSRINKYYLKNILNTEMIRSLVLSKSSTSTMPFISGKELKLILIPLPSILEQEEITLRINKEQELVNASKQLIALFEQKIKDRIARVWGDDVKTPHGASLSAPPNENHLMAAEPEGGYGKEE